MFWYLPAGQVFSTVRSRILIPALHSFYDYDYDYDYDANIRMYTDTY